MTPLVNQDVLGLQVAIRDALLVQMLQSHDELANVKGRRCARQTTCVAQKSEQLASRDILHKKVQVERILKRTLQTNHVWTFHAAKQLSLVTNVLNLMLMQHALLFHHLQGKEGSRDEVANQKYASKRALACSEDTDDEYCR